jgi:hypothetical protein
MGAVCDVWELLVVIWEANGIGCQPYGALWGPCATWELYYSTWEPCVTVKELFALYGAMRLVLVPEPGRPLYIGFSGTYHS